MTLLARAEHRRREGKAPSANIALVFMLVRLLTFVLAAAWTIRTVGPVAGLVLIVSATLTRAFLTRSERQSRGGAGGGAA